MRGFILFALSLACCVSQASAGGYASVYGGANWDTVIDVPYVEAQQGYVAGATLGRTIPAIPGLRVEADLSYRTNDVDIFDGCLKAKHETTGLLFNVAYDFGSGPLKPYLLAGAGMARTTGTIPGLFSIGASDLAYQVGGGVQMQIMPGVSAGLGYRFFQAPIIELYGTELSNGENHSAVASLSFDL